MLDNLSDILNNELEMLADNIAMNHEAAGQKVSGETMKSLEVVVGNGEGQLLGATHVGVLERGRKPGKTPKDFIDILKKWIAAKGLNFQNEEELTRFANAIKWKIKRDGSQLYRNNGRQDIYTPAIEDFEQRLSSRVAAYFEIAIKNEIETKAK